MKHPVTEVKGWSLGMTLHRFASVFYLPETWPRWPAEYDDFPAPLWEAGGLERYVHGRGHGKICPLCLCEQPALLLPWSLRPITTCLKHQIILVDHCPAGQHDLVIDQRRGSCAICGYALNQLPVTALPAQEESRQLTQLLWRAVGCGEEDFPHSWYGVLERLIQQEGPLTTTAGTCFPALLCCF